MNKKIIFGLIAFIAIMVGVVLYQGKDKKKGIKVAVEEVGKRTIVETVAASGKIYPETEVKISSDVSGEIVELYIQEGDSVKVGQLLLKIRPDSYKSVVERAEANVNSSRAQWANSKAQISQFLAQKEQAVAQKQQIIAQIENTRAIHKRNQQLHKEGVISDADFDASLSSLRSLEANLASAEATIKSAEASIESGTQGAKSAEFNIKSAEASVREARENLLKTTIYAPMSGTVSVLNVEKGERVVGTLQMAGTEIMRISNLNTMEVQVEVSESDVLRVATNNEVDVEVDAYLDRKFQGRVTHISNSSNDIATAALTTDQVTNFTVKILLDPASYSDLIRKGQSPFRPGMSASVEIKTRQEKEVLSVPIQAVTTREKDEENADLTKEAEILEVVFVAVGDSCEMRPVKTGIQDNDYIQITEGLKLEEAVISEPYSAISRKLKQGEAINVVEKEELYKAKKQN